MEITIKEKVERKINIKTPLYFRWSCFTVCILEDKVIQIVNLKNNYCIQQVHIDNVIENLQQSNSEIITEEEFKKEYVRILNYLNFNELQIANSYDNINSETV